MLFRRPGFRRKRGKKMNGSSDTQITVQDETVVTLDYTLRVDGEIIDSSDENEPIQFIQGLGQIIPGLEKNLYGMSIGESKTVIVPPREGYGEIDANAFADIPRSEFPKNIPLEPGVAIEVRDQRGESMDAYIVAVNDKDVRLNFNHPLAGKELHFSIKILDLRSATEEELAHGHVHGSAGEQWVEEEEDLEEYWGEDEEDWEEEGEEWDEDDEELIDIDEDDDEV